MKCSLIRQPGRADRAVNIDPLAPARLFDRELVLFWCPATGRPRRMGRMYGVRKQHGLVFGQGIQQIIVALDESLLLLCVELARDDVGLVILQPQTIQKRDQSRAAFINEGEFLLDPGADLAGRTRQRRTDPRLQIVFLLHTQIACAPAHIKAGNAFDPALLEQLVPAADGVVVIQQRIGDLLSAPALVQQHQGICTPCHPARRRPLTCQRCERLAIFVAEEARANHKANRNPSNRKMQETSAGSSMSRGRTDIDTQPQPCLAGQNGWHIVQLYPAGLILIYKKHKEAFFSYAGFQRRTQVDR